MAGIAGQVDFAENIGRHHVVVRNMVASLANRGPDGEKLWVGEHAVIGHRRLAVEGSEHGAQPVVATDDGVVLAVLAFDGEIYNVREVRSRLTSVGRRSSGSDTAQVLAQAYLEWGDAFAEHLEGPFAIVVWDARTEELLLVRDRLGVKPLYYYRLPTGVVFGSEPKAVLVHPLVEAVADEDSLREALSFTSTAGHGMFRGMRKLHPGSVVRVTSAAVEQHIYWQLTARPHVDDQATTVATVRGLLEDAVERQLGDGGITGVLLSGGIDSSAVAALAAARLAKRGDTLRTYTIGFPAADGTAAGDAAADLTFAADVARWLGADHTEIRLAAADMTDPMVRSRMVESQQDMPTPVCAYPAAFRQLCMSVATRTNTALTGQRADTLFSAFMGLDDPAVINAQMLPWIAFGQRRTAGAVLGTGLFDPGLIARLDIPAYCADQYRDDVARTPQVPGADPRERRMRELVYLFYRGWFEMNVSLDESAAMSTGLELRWPFADTRLLEYAFNIPWDVKIPDGRDKGLLRSAVADLLPEHVVERPASSFPITKDPRYTAFLREQLAALALDDGAPVRPLLDPVAVRKVVDGEVAGGNPWVARTDIEMVLQVDAWLRLHRVRLAL